MLLCGHACAAPPARQEQSARAITLSELPFEPRQLNSTRHDNEGHITAAHKQGKLGINWRT
jgi:hypothetical protein